MMVAVGFVSVYRDFGVSERSAAFTPLPLGTLCVALRIFPSAGKGSTVKRPEGRAPGALGWGAKQILGFSPSGGSGYTGRRRATLEWTLGSSVAPRLLRN